MFMYQGWYLYEEKKTSFLTLFMANFGQRLLRSKSWRQCGAPPVPVAFTKEFFSFLDRMVLFLSSLGLFFFSLYIIFLFIQRTFFRSLFFHEQRFIHKQTASTCLYIARCKQNMEITRQSSLNMSGCSENSLRGFARVWDYDAFLIY